MVLPDDAAELTQRYDRYALAYHELWAPILRRAARRLLDELRGEPARRILDVGAGTGALFGDWREAFPSAAVTGLDRSAGMLALAPHAMPRVVADARRLPIRDESIDLVAFLFMLFHLPDPDAALAEARRVLRAGGRIGAVTWAADFESPAHAIWSRCLDDHGAAPPDPGAAARHEAVDTPEKVAALLRDAGIPAAHAWQEERVESMRPDLVIQLKTRMGSEKVRYDGLAPEVRLACVAAARRAMASLGEADFMARGRMVYAVGRSGPVSTGAP